MTRMRAPDYKYFMTRAATKYISFSVYFNCILQYDIASSEDIAIRIATPNYF